MNLSEIRTILRRQIQDTPEAQFTDAELNVIINEAYVAIQMVIYKHDREAHIAWETIPTTVGVNWYPLPETFGINQIKMKTAASDTTWTLLQKKSLNDIELLRIAGPQYYYARRGQWFGVFPTPSVTISDGFQLLHSPVMQLAVDTDVPKIKRPLHMAILWLARIYAQDEDEAVDLSKVEDRLNSMLKSIPEWYEANSDEPDRFMIDVNHVRRNRNRDNSAIFPGA